MSDIVWVRWSRCTGKQKAHKSEPELWNELEPNENYAPYINKDDYDKLQSDLAAYRGEVSPAEGSGE